MSKYSASVRHYNSDGVFVRKYKAFGFDTELGLLKTLDLLMMNVTDMAPTWCNVMIRENGKLISYKSLYTNQDNKG